MLNKLFGGKKRNSADEGRTNPSLVRHGRPKYTSFCMPERSDNPPLGYHGPCKSVSFSMQERSDNPSPSNHGPPKFASFSMPRRLDNPPLGRPDPPQSTSFSMPGRSDNPPFSRHGPPDPTSLSVPGRSDNPPLSRHGPPISASFCVSGLADDPMLGRHGLPKSSASFSVPGRSEIRSRSSAALKIIHAGGIAEYYYMATPAARILEKHPTSILANPDIFKKPWDSVVHKDEILIPGQKYYVVPQHTLKKLRRKIKKNNISFISQSSQLDSSKSQNMTSIIKNKSSNDKTNARNRRVWFSGIDYKQDSSCSSISLEEDHGKILNDQHRIIRAYNRNVLTWQPTLTVINEK